ncbi:hypothetical protein CAPTEDRAFT_77509, partial [Capitella teleta]
SSLKVFFELARCRKEELLVCFLNLAKAFDRVDRKKLIEVLRMKGYSEKIVSVLQDIY